MSATTSRSSSGSTIQHQRINEATPVSGSTLKTQKGSNISSSSSTFGTKELKASLPQQININNNTSSSSSKYLKPSQSITSSNSSFNSASTQSLIVSNNNSTMNKLKHLSINSNNDNSIGMTPVGSSSPLLNNPSTLYGSPGINADLTNKMTKHNSLKYGSTRQVYDNDNSDTNRYSSYQEENNNEINDQNTLKYHRNKSKINENSNLNRADYKTQTSIPSNSSSPPSSNSNNYINAIASSTGGAASSMLLNNRTNGNDNGNGFIAATSLSKSLFNSSNSNLNVNGQQQKDQHLLYKAELNDTYNNDRGTFFSDANVNDLNKTNSNTKLNRSLSQKNEQKTEQKKSQNQTAQMQNKIDQLDFMTTVGTGTFGRVIVVRDKVSKAYFALKIMSIAEVLRLKQTEHVKNEKEILSQINHPFIINLYWTCHNEKFLYMLLEYVCGGELFSYLRNAVKFSNETAVFFGAEIVSALEYLHSLSIIYRDLKPENLLIDRVGHVRLCDFGFAKKVYDRTWTLCGTPEYLAPEIIVGKGHHKAVDWWALGILIYEMVVGYPPFYDENPFQIYQKILAGKIDWPRNIDLHAKDLIKKLLTSDRTKRLGSMKNGTDDIKRHKWFKAIDWDLVLQKKLVPPIVPKVSGDGDTKNFDKYDEENWKDVPNVSSKNLQPFEDF